MNSPDDGMRLPELLRHGSGPRLKQGNSLARTATSSYRKEQLSMITVAAAGRSSKLSAERHCQPALADVCASSASLAFTHRRVIRLPLALSSDAISRQLWAVRRACWARVIARCGHFKTARDQQGTRRRRAKSFNADNAVR